MKLYVVDPATGKKVFIKMVAKNKKALRDKVKSDVLSVQGRQYLVTEVRAESGANEPIVGGVLGGIIGALGGGPGVVIGGLIGGAVAAAQSEKEKKDVEIFNGSEL